MYCPSCKNFNDADFNPMENIQKFMKYVESEETKWQAYLYKLKLNGKKIVKPKRELGQRIEKP